MPLSCANAFRPTIALLYCTGNEVTAATSLRGARQHLGVDAGPERHHVVAHPHRHHDLFERGVAGALADAVDGAFDLPRAGAHAGERIRHRHAEIVMAVHGKARLVGIRHPFAQHLDEREIFLRHGIADGVGNVDGGGAGLDRGLDAAAEEIVFGAGAVLARPFDVVGVAARARHLRDHHLVDLVRLLLQLVFHVHRRGGQEGVDAPPLRRPDRFGAAVDVLEGGAREPADHGVLGASGDFVDGGEVALRGDRKAGLDDVDAHLVEQLGDFELLLVGHGRAGALLAVAQGGVENDDAVLFGLGFERSWCQVLLGLRPADRLRVAGALWGLRVAVALSQTPECPGANAQSALRGR